MSINRTNPLARFFRSLGLGPLLIAALVFCAASVGAAPTLPDDKAQTVVHMLDYVSVDYPEFVKDGKVLDAAEYEEQREFATQAIALM